jgi:hypothetical protein
LASFEETDTTRALAVDRDGTKAWTYWTAEECGETLLHDDAEYEDAFRHALARSVTSRCAGRRPRHGKATSAPPSSGLWRRPSAARSRNWRPKPGALADWKEPRALDALWNRCLSEAGSRAWFTLWRAAVASRWLHHHGFA